MTQAFDCPKCGAPISFEPQPGAETVVCSYCNETVIIPPELRVPLPEVVVQPPPPFVQPRRPNVMVIAIILVIVVAACVGAVLLADSSDQSSSDSSIDTPTSVMGSATATVEAAATNEALQPIIKLMQSWPASFTENFTDNSHQWDTGDVRDSYIAGNRSISHGTYTWNITAVQSTSDFSFPDMPDQPDFFASVDLKLVNMPDDPNADAGMVFRHNSSDHSWYYFSANDQGQYYFGWYNGSDWHTLIPETDSAAIHPGQINRLTVGAQGSQFIFFINGQLVDHFIDENLKSGDVGVGLNLPKEGEKASIEFANFSVLSSSPNP